jgi:anti-anti-sigma factor
VQLPSPPPPPPDGTVELLGRTVRCVGEFDAGNCWQLENSLRRAAAEGPGFHVDLCGVTFVDSSILNALFDTAEHKAVVIVQAGTLVSRIVRLIGLEQALEVREVPA